MYTVDNFVANLYVFELQHRLVKFTSHLVVIRHASLSLMTVERL